MPEVRETWAAHTASGYYIGNAWEHYRCHQVYISSSKCKRVNGTVFSGTSTSQCLLLLRQTHLLKQRTILSTSYRADSPRTASQLMPWNSLWRYTRSKPRKPHAKPELKGCSGNKCNLKGWWRSNKRKCHSQQAPSKTSHPSHPLKLKTVPTNSQVQAVTTSYHKMKTALLY
jgi:hypothetical protein